MMKIEKCSYYSNDLESEIKNDEREKWNYYSNEKREMELLF